MNPVIDRHREAILDLCRACGVARLVSSARRLRMPSTRTDAMWTSSPPTRRTMTSGRGCRGFRELEDALADELGQDFDLVMTSALRNRWFAREAAKTRTVI